MLLRDAPQEQSHLNLASTAGNRNMEPSLSREQLGDGVFLTTEVKTKPLEYLYTVENQVTDSLG